MNFTLAAELAEDEGIEVASVLTNDDVAVENSLYTAGRRGVGGHRLLAESARAQAAAWASPFCSRRSPARRRRRAGRSTRSRRWHEGSTSRVGASASRSPRASLP